MPRLFHALIVAMRSGVIFMLPGFANSESFGRLA